MEWTNVLSLGVCILFSLLARHSERKQYAPTWLSSIIACYVVGILISNLRLWPQDNSFLETVAAASMLFGLPLLLFAVRIRQSIKYAGSMLFAFALCCISGLICTAVVGWQMAGQIPDAEKAAGMLVGLYTGGTPNVQTIGLALDASPDYLVLVQAADVLLGGAYLLGLITFLPAIYARLYRPTPGTETGPNQLTNSVSEPSKQILQFLIALIVVAISVGITYVLTGGLSDLTVLILAMTTVALLFSTFNWVQQTGNPYPLGEYFILVFSVALGLMADFRELAENGLGLLYFSFLALSSTTILHLLLSKLFNLDRDTVILSSVAGFYGPVFVVQVAAALQNQRLLAPGIAVSLLGFGIGNYLGIGLAYFLSHFVY